MNGAGAMRESGDRCQDFVGCVRSVNERSNGALKRPDAVVDATTKRLRLERREPPFDEVEPGRVSRREVRMEPGMSSEPSSDQRGLVRPVVVHDHVHVEMRGDLIVKGREKRGIRS